MKHLGDITKINGYDAPPVNVIIGGNPCQDLSVAGKRAGLAGERSGLFMEQIRIIKEMRTEDIKRGRKSTDIRPRYMVWENVPGAFSSNKGQDFRAVLEETIGIVKEDKSDIPVPKNGWHYSGIIMGDGFSLAWRVFDAQFWGVPQRRRRIALVADFGGFTAPEILFERKGVSRYTPPRGTPWEDFAAALAERFGGTNTARENGTAAGFNGWKSVTGSIQYQEERAPTIEANMPPNVVEKTYCIQGNCIDRADTAGCNGRGWTEGVSYTLNTVDRPAVYDARGNGDGKTAPTITGDHNNRVTDYTALCVRERCGCEGGGKGLLVQEEKSGTLAANNDQFVIAHGFPLGFRPENVKTYEEAATTICCGTRAGHCNGVIAIDRAAFNQGENAQYDPKISEDGINSTLTSKGPSAVCAAFSSRAGSKSGSIAYQEEQSPTLRAGLLDTSVLKYCDDTVRRLTPLECERLQGFPDNWTQIGELIGFEECEDELGEKWKIGIYEYIDSNGKKRKTSDSARYRALGNSIALPSWVWVLERLSYCCGAYRTMASLFDGIGGFPLIWETLNGEGTCIWASEIEEFPIAVTKYHFKRET